MTQFKSPPPAQPVTPPQKPQERSWFDAQRTYQAAPARPKPHPWRRYKNRFASKS